MRITHLFIFLLLNALAIEVACGYSGLESLLVETQEQSRDTKVQELEKFIQDHSTNIAVTRTAELIRLCLLIPGPRTIPTEEIEHELTQISLSDPQSWESKFASYSIINLLHTDGQHNRVIELSEPMLEDEYFESFFSNTDPSFKLFTRFYPITVEKLKFGLYHQLAIAHEKAGNADQVTEFREKIESLKLQPNNYRPKSSIDTKREPQNTIQRKSIDEIPAKEGSVWPFILFGLILLGMIAVVGFKVLGKSS